MNKFLFLLSAFVLCTLTAYGREHHEVSSEDSAMPSTAVATTVSWSSLVGKPLLLGRYGAIGNGGAESNSFYNSTNEYLVLQNNGVMIWNNSLDGDRTYYYTIVGKKVYFGATRGSRDCWLDLVSSGDSYIKTNGYDGTYRYYKLYSASAAMALTHLWPSLVGKSLKLGQYGGISSDGTELNSYYNNTNERLQIQSNGIMMWANKQDGDASYYYTIVGSRIYYGNTKGSRAYWMQIVWREGNCIKTRDSYNTYRYFKW